MTSHEVKVRFDKRARRYIGTCDNEKCVFEVSSIHESQAADQAALHERRKNK